MSNQNETRRFPTFGAALDRIEACEGLPIHIRAEIIDRVCDAHDGAPSDFIEARTMLHAFARVMRRENRDAVKALIDGIDLDAIRDESARVGCNYRDEPVGDEQAATDRARQRLADIGLDESFLDIELKGCTFSEHLEWINTAPAEELRAYRAEMLGGAA